MRQETPRKVWAMNIALIILPVITGGMMALPLMILRVQPIAYVLLSMGVLISLGMAVLCVEHVLKHGHG